MKNLTTLTAGDSASWHDDPFLVQGEVGRYTSADWSLTYQLRGPNHLVLTAVPEGDGWRTNITAAQSGALQAGVYAWSRYVVQGLERRTTGFGSLTIRPDLAAGEDYVLDPRSQAERALADCEAALASFKSSGGKVTKYTIGSRSTEFASLSELLRVRTFWQQRVNKERASAAIANGGSNPRRLLVRF